MRSEMTQTATRASVFSDAVRRHGAQEVRSLKWWAVSHRLARPLHHATANTGTLEAVVVRVETAGATGFAEVRSNGAYATGEDRRQIEEALGSVQTGSPVSEATAMVLGSSRLAAMALDIAAWDALGQEEGVPLHHLWGAAAVAEVETHAQIGFGDVEATEALAARFSREGFRRLKVRVGSPDPGFDVRRIAAVRRVVGDAVVISADANAAWSREQAASVLDEFADLGVTWLEQPVRSTEDLAAITAHGRPRIMADESARDDATITALGASGVVHGVHLKLEKAGTVARLAASIENARASGLEVALGQMDQGRLGCAATTQLAAGFGFGTAELWGCAEVEDDIAGTLTIRDGAVQVPQGPGLGMTVSQHVATKGTP